MMHCGSEETMVIEDHAPLDLGFQPLTSDRWTDFEALFGKRGAYGGCWCMWWRCTRREFEQQQGEGNRLAMKALVDSGVIPGILACHAGQAIGWCSIAPREQFGALERSPVLKRLDDQPVWSLVCLFVHREFRGRGVAQALIGGALHYAQSQGASVVEAYPTVPREDRLPPVSSFMGVPALFEQAGFVECARPSKSRAIMRYER
jgi:GNAT superfamily N-acetyltransferase